MQTLKSTENCAGKGQINSLSKIDKFPMDCSWHWKRLHKIKNQLQAGFSCGMIANPNGTYSVSKTYEWLKGPQQRFPYAAVVWNRINIPKHCFIMWLGMHKKLLTVERMLSWNLVINNGVCLLCKSCTDSITHLFFQCEFSKELANNMCEWMQVVPCQFEEWRRWIKHQSCKRNARAQIQIACFTAMVYHIWGERNMRFHTQEEQSVSAISRRIRKQ